MLSDKLFKNIGQDLPASIVVFFVAIPLCLGIALASGAPLFSGLMAGMVGGMVVGSISNSALGVSGPAAGLTVIVLSAITSLGSFEAFLLSVVIAGGIQILLGALKAGVVAYYFPSSVIKGMLSAIGIIIFLKQIPHALGYDFDYEGDLSFWQRDGENTFTELIKMLDYISPGAALLSILTIALLLTWDVYLSKKHRFFKMIQGPIVAVAFGILYQLSAAAFFPEFAIEGRHFVTVPVAESLEGFSKFFTFPDISRITDQNIWIAAVTIAAVASIESLLSVEATDKLDPYKRTTNTNRELLAQGTGNVVSGLLGGLPVTQVIIRSSANVQSGGKTKLSAIMHGIFIMVCIITIPGILNMIPLAALACILFPIGYKLANPKLLTSMYKLGGSQFYPFIVTIVGILFTDLLVGIGMGLVVGIFILLRNNFKNSHFLHKKTVEDGHTSVTMTLSEEVTFLNKGTILETLRKLPNESHLTIDIGNSVHIDYDIMEIINNFKNTAENRKITVEIIGGREIVTADY